MSECHSCNQDVADAGCDFLRPESNSNISKTIEIDGSYSYILKGYNIEPGTHAVVEIVSGYGDSIMTTPFVINGRRMELNSDTSVLVLKNAGRYRVVVVDDSGAPVPGGEAIPTICAERAEQSCGCSEGTDMSAKPPPCPAVTVTLDASVDSQITATVTGGPGTATITPGGMALYGTGPFVFDGLASGMSHVVMFVSDCGSKGSASAKTNAAIPVIEYCPSFRFDGCDCDEVGFGYRDNALKDPAATVKVTACDGATVMWIYPNEGVTGNVRHEVPYSEDGGNTVLGYLANQSDCAPPHCCDTNVYVTNKFSPQFKPTTNVAAPNVTLPAPNVVAADWVGIDGEMKITLSDGSTVTTDPIPACDN